MVESGYYFGFPHRSGEYPNSKDESEIVLERMENPDMEFFTLSDESPRVPFGHRHPHWDGKVNSAM